MHLGPGLGLGLGSDFVVHWDPDSRSGSEVWGQVLGSSFEVWGTHVAPIPPHPNQLSHSGPTFVRYTSQQLSRVYPLGLKMTSSNYNPQEMWNVGCQLGEPPAPRVP